jgi:hypothetical protein
MRAHPGSIHHFRDYNLLPTAIYIHTNLSYLKTCSKQTRNKKYKPDHVFFLNYVNKLPKPCILLTMHNLAKQLLKYDLQIVPDHLLITLYHILIHQNIIHSSFNILSTYIYDIYTSIILLIALTGIYYNPNKSIIEPHYCNLSSESIKQNMS